jgi:hypothetical protein
VCCAMFGAGGGGGIACAAQCMGGAQLCASSAECPMGDSCVPGFGGMGMVCRRPRGDGGLMRPDGGLMRDAAAMPDTGATTDGATE